LSHNGHVFIIVIVACYCIPDRHSMSWVVVFENLLARASKADGCCMFRVISELWTWTAGQIWTWWSHTLWEV